MRTRLQTWAAVLLAAALIGSTSISVGAQLDGRSVVIARQQVRASVAAAMADGRLSTRERYSILLEAERLLPPEEFRRLEHSFARQFARQQAPLPPPPSEDADSQRAEDKRTGEEQARQEATEQIAQTALTLLEGEKRAETASFDLPPAPSEPEDPFKEETIEETYPVLGGVFGGTLDDEALIFEDDCNAFGGLCSFYATGFRHLSMTTTVDAFKGPMDLDNLNGNFGFQFGINGGFLVAPRLGVGFQAGTSAVLTDFQGTQFTGSEIRAQNFTTIGLYQRVPMGPRELKWGFAYDFLFDDYYTSFEIGQWRVKLACELNPCDEVGIWACIPNDGERVRLGSAQHGYTVDLFKPVAQGNFYHRRCWEGGTATTAWIGLAEEPGEFVFGADARVPISSRLAFVGNFNYVLPSASGADGQDEEMWNVSLGLEFTPGWGLNQCRASKWAPLFNLANNGTFAIRRY